MKTDNLYVDEKCNICKRNVAFLLFIAIFSIKIYLNGNL